jgi:uncharacterized protein (DUF362 family)
MPVFVRPVKKILIKPNLLISEDPSKAVTTHPEIARSVIKNVELVNFEAVGSKEFDIKDKNTKKLILRTQF